MNSLKFNLIYKYFGALHLNPGQHTLFYKYFGALHFCKCILYSKYQVLYTIRKHLKIPGP